MPRFGRRRPHAGRGHRAAGPLGCFVLTVSDTRTPASDASGHACMRMVVRAGHRVAGYALVRDDPRQIRSAVRRALASASVHAVLVNGGTGISPRDVTAESLSGFFTKELPGFGELFRQLSFREVGSSAMLSRATAGISGDKPVFAMPGSGPAVKLAKRRLVLPDLPHQHLERTKGKHG